MPPAFNLSQDQTLQFDLDFLLLGIEVNFITEFHFIFLRAFKVMRPELCVTTVFWHSPSNAHAYRLLIFKEQSFSLVTFSAAELIQRRPRFWHVFLKLVKNLIFFFLRNLRRARLF